MLKNNSRTLQGEKKIARKRFKKMEKLLEIATHKMSGEMSQNLNALSGNGACVEALVASDMALRWVGAKALKSEILRHRRGRKKGNRQYVFGTLADDTGNTSDRCPVVALKQIRDKAYRAIKSVGLHAVVVIEVHPLMNHPGQGMGRTLMYHAHFIGWSDELINPEIMAGVMQAAGSWSNSLGADPVHIKEIGDSAADLAAVAYYVLKPPHSAKNRMPNDKKPGKFLLMDTIKGYRPELLVRVLEGLSQIDFTETIFGVNDGGLIRQAVRRRVTDWHRNRIKGGVALDSSVDVWRMWHEWRQSVGSKNFLAYRIFGGSLMPQASKIRQAPRKRGRPGSRVHIGRTPRQLRAARKRKPLP